MCGKAVSSSVMAGGGDAGSLDGKLLVAAAYRSRVSAFLVSVRPCRSLCPRCCCQNLVRTRQDSLATGISLASCVISVAKRPGFPRAKPKSSPTEQTGRSRLLTHPPACIHASDALLYSVLAAGALCIDLHALLAARAGTDSHSLDSAASRLRGTSANCSAHLLRHDEVADVLLEPGGRSAPELVVARLDTTLVLIMSAVPALDPDQLLTGVS